MKDWRALLSDLELAFVRRENELNALRELDRTILSESKTLEDTYELILKHASEILKARYAEILIRRKNELEVVASNSKMALKRRVALNNSVSGKCIIDDQIINCGNVRTDPRYKDIYQEMRGSEKTNMTSELVVPMRVANTIIGVFNVESPEENAFDSHDATLLETLAGQATIAFQRAKLYDDLAFFRQIQGDTLFSFSNEIDIETILRRAMSQLETYLGPQKFAQILFIDRDNLVVVFSTADNELGIKVPISDSASGEAVLKKETQIILDVKTYPKYKRMLGRDIVSEMIVPIKLQDEVIGVINLESEEQAFDDFSKFITENFARQIATIVLPLKLRLEVETHKEREQAEAILLAIGSQTSNFIHRLNNDVGAIRVMAEEIQMDCQEELDRNSFLAERIARIHSNALEALQLPKDMKKQITELEEVDVNLEIKKNLDKVKIPENIKIETHLATNLPKPKASFFDLVINNLVRNSIDAMPNGGTLTLSTELISFERLQDRRIKIIIKDSGVGIEKEKQKKIFEMGFSEKVNNVNKERKGLGFGLWWVKTFIKRVGGDIEVKSKPMQGTEFEIRLPV